VILFSRTGHTLSVATKLAKALTADGQTVTIQRLIPIGRSTPGTIDLHLEAFPDPAPYDALVLGTPVEGGIPSAPMATYMAHITSLQKKPVALLVLQGFPFQSWGGNQTVAKMKSLCEDKGARVLGSGIVNWLNLQRGQQIADVVEHLSELIRVG